MSSSATFHCFHGQSPQSILHWNLHHRCPHFSIPTLCFYHKWKELHIKDRLWFINSRWRWSVLSCPHSRSQTACSLVWTLFSMVMCSNTQASLLLACWPDLQHPGGHSCKCQLRGAVLQCRVPVIRYKVKLSLQSLIYWFKGKSAASVARIWSVVFSVLTWISECPCLRVMDLWIKFINMK